MKQPLIRDRHFYILVLLFALCTVIYYFGELVNLIGWEALRWEIFYTVHDPHRMLFLIPILYSSYCYRLRGAIIAVVISLLLFLPRAFLISPYPDASLRMIIFVIVAAVISMMAAVILNDRDKHKNYIDTLKASEERYRNVLEHMFDSYYEVDLAGNFTYVNDAACLNLGYSKEELIGNNFQIALSANTAKAVFQAYHVVYSSGEPNKGFTFEVRRKDGTTGFAESSVSLRKNAKGEITGFRSVSRDITERKQAEEKIRRTAAEWQATFDSIADLVSIQDNDYKLVRVNKAYADTFQKKPEELAGRYCYEVVHKTSCPIDNCPHQQALKTRTSAYSEMFESRLGVFLGVSCSPIFNEQGEISGTIHIAKDITERKKAEETLREREAQYRELFDHMSSGVAVYEAVENGGDFIIRDFNPAAEKIEKISRKDILGKRVSEAFPGVKTFGIFEVFQRVWQTGKPEHFPENIYKDDKDTGSWRESWVFKLPGGEVVAVYNDVSERRQAEETLQKSEEKYRSLIENINDVFYTLDTQGNISYVSPVVERFTKYKISDLIGKPFIPLIYPDDLPGLLDSFNRLATGKLEPWEFRIMDKDGRVIFVRTSSRPLYEDGEIVGFTALMTDITERKQLEQKLVEMATHDFLTGLPNRVLLLDRFNIAAALAHRNKVRLAVMSLDLDKFKTINDTLGHDTGDEVLRAVSTRLTGIIRASDTLARVGGDEFILVMMETNHMEDATAAAQKILDSFAEPFIIDGHQLYLSTSIGIAIYPADAKDMETLTRQSDAAMYYSKGHGRNRFKFFGEGDVRMSGDHRSAPLA